MWHFASRNINYLGLKIYLWVRTFYFAGKPFHDSTFSRNQLQAYIDVKKGKVISGWTKRLCCISGTRLLVYKGLPLFYLI